MNIKDQKTIKMCEFGIEEMAGWLRELAALSEGLSAHNLTPTPEEQILSSPPQ